MLLVTKCRSQGQCSLRRRYVVARLQRLWFRIPPGARIFVGCKCCILSGRGLCNELFTRPEESYRLWCDVVCDLKTSRMRRPWLGLGRRATRGRKKIRITSPPPLLVSLNQMPFIPEIKLSYSKSS